MEYRFGMIEKYTTEETVAILIEELKEMREIIDILLKEQQRSAEEYVELEERVMRLENPDLD